MRKIYKYIILIIFILFILCSKNYAYVLKVNNVDLTIPDYDDTFRTVLGNSYGHFIAVNKSNLNDIQVYVFRSKDSYIHDDWSKSNYYLNGNITLYKYNSTQNKYVYSNEVGSGTRFYTGYTHNILNCNTYNSDKTIRYNFYPYFAEINDFVSLSNDYITVYGSGVYNNSGFLDFAVSLHNPVEGEETTVFLLHLDKESAYYHNSGGVFFDIPVNLFKDKLVAGRVYEYTVMSLAPQSVRTVSDTKLAFYNPDSSLVAPDDDKDLVTPDNPDNPDNPNNPSLQLPDLSMNGILNWVWQQNEELTGLTREQIQQTEEFKELQREIAQKNELHNASLLDIIKRIFDVLNPFSENFFVKTLIKWLGELLEGLFVPDQERFTAIGEVFQRKFAFVDSVKEMINSLDNVISNLGNTPKLSINVHSKYYDGELQTIDMSWFKEFKNYTDLVITGFCYLFFLWRFFVTIPEIIGNRGSMRVAEDSALKGVSGRK